MFLLLTTLLLEFLRHEKTYKCYSWAISASFFTVSLEHYYCSLVGLEGLRGACMYIEQDMFLCCYSLEHSMNTCERPKKTLSPL